MFKGSVNKMMRKQMKNTVILSAVLICFILFIVFWKQHCRTELTRAIYSGSDVIVDSQTSDSFPEGNITNGFIFSNRSQPHIPQKTMPNNVNSKICSILDSRPDNFIVDAFPYFKQDFSILNGPMYSWIAPKVTITTCDDKIKIFDARFGLLKNIIMDNSKRVGASNLPKGGEPFKTAVGREVRLGHFMYQKGFWKLWCMSKEINDYVPKTFHWFPFTEITTSLHEFEKASAGIDIDNKFTIAITREDYWNLHNFIRQMYNVFLIMMFFHKKPSETSILFLDAHPSNVFDSTWEYIFGPVSRAGEFTGPVLYQNLVWGFRESDGGLTDFQLKQQAYLEEFRSYLLTLHGLSDSKPLNCQDIVVTIILRRGHINSPINTSGRSQRQIFNEAELVETLMKTFPTARVQSILMESLPMCRQLEISSTTDVLIGMHGAGMTHSVFLPKHATILEMFPKNWKKGRPWYLCYEKIASWRGLNYDSWENFDSSQEMANYYTIVPIDVVIKKTQVLISKMCS